MEAQPIKKRTEQVWRELHADLLRFLRRRVPDAATAEDLLQEVFLRIHNRLGTLQDDQRLRAWIYRIARNAITDYFRAAKRGAPASLDLEPVADETSDANLNLEVAGWLEGMIDELPDTYRQAVRLAELGEISQKEVASRLGLSISAAKPRIQRGRKLLKDALLRCCHFEFDERGNVIDFQQRDDCSTCCDDDQNCTS